MTTEIYGPSVLEALLDLKIMRAIVEVVQLDPLQLHEIAEIIDYDISLLYDPIAVLVGSGMVEKITNQVAAGINGSNEVNFYFVPQS